MSEKLVHIVDGAAELATTDELTMIYLLEGFLDAGNATSLIANHLESLSDGPVVATFDVDAFHDYRARRPGLTFAKDHFADYDAPRLTARLLKDSSDTPYLLLRGPEPDHRWEAFVRAVRELVDSMGVTRLVSLGAVPMAVPHTRPLTVTPHATRAELVVGESNWENSLRVPASASAVVEYRMGEWGYPCLGFVVHVPHYLAQGDFPQAALSLLEKAEVGGRLLFDLSELRKVAEATEREVGEYLAQNEELAGVVSGLEQQYDAFQASAAANRNLLAHESELPTGEELGRQFEQFLADLDRRDGQDH